MYRNSTLIKIQPDATVRRYLFTAKLLYMFRVSQHPSSGVLKTVTAASGTGHNTGAATSLQRGLIRPRWREVAVLIQPDATVCRYLFTAKSLYMFRVSQHPSSGVLKTVTGTDHNIGTATPLQRGLIRPRWREVAAPVLWPVPEAAVTVFRTSDDGCCDTRNM